MDVDIYVGGGQHVALKVGDQLEFSIKQIEAKLNLDMPGFDSLENIRSALCIGRRNDPEHPISDDDTIAELKAWAGADDQTFMIKAIRKFRLFWPYSTALRGLFFDVVDYYKRLVRLLLDQLGEQEMASQIEVEYAESKTKSSSPLLYGFGKYEPLNELLAKHKHTELLDYIKDPDQWAYPGFCPFVSTDRFKKLCKFPLDLIIDIIGEDKVDKLKFATDPKELKHISPPELPTDIVEHGAQGTPIELAKAILIRLTEHKDLIHSWETYYIECAKQVSSISSVNKK